MREDRMIITADHFDPWDIARSGQCFRMSASSPDAVEALAGDKKLIIRSLGEDRFQLDCPEAEYRAFWRDYLDLGQDYEPLWRAALHQDEALARAAAQYPGLRILRQDPWETLCSFLLSQRKSIPAIRTCIAQLCRAAGAERAGFFAFPTPEALLNAGEDAVRACGTGYRAPYLMDAARRAASGALPLRKMRAWPNGRILEALLAVRGVGVKVASCVLLYGYHRLDVWPVDVWISRVVQEDFGGRSPFEGYGKYAGVYQQYLFLERLDREKRRPAPPHVLSVSQ